MKNDNISNQTEKLFVFIVSNKTQILCFFPLTSRRNCLNAEKAIGRPVSGVSEVYWQSISECHLTASWWWFYYHERMQFIRFRQTHVHSNTSQNNQSHVTGNVWIILLEIIFILCVKLTLSTCYNSIYTAPNQNNGHIKALYIVM